MHIREKVQLLQNNPVNAWHEHVWFTNQNGGDYSVNRNLMERQLKSYEKLNVVMYLNPQTGKVAEVSFWFISSDPFSTIPISTYRDIEMKLKNQISYKPSEIGKQLNFIMLSLMHKPLGALSAPSKTIAPTK